MTKSIRCSHASGLGMPGDAYEVSLCSAFKGGNPLQALIFALPHVVIDGSASTMDILVRIINAFLLGYAFGYVVERKSCGSILPIMTAHALINIINSSILMVVL